MTNEHFKHIIGQEAAKRKLNFFIDSFQDNDTLPHLLFVAEKGSGKTSLAQATARQLVLKGEKRAKNNAVINCATIKGRDSFIQDVVVGLDLQNSNFTLIFDEASELPKDVQMIMLTMLNPTKDYRNTLHHKNQAYDIDFRRLSFMFATTRPQQVYPELISRLERIDLEPYTIPELGTIIKQNSGSIQYNDNLLPEIAGRVRGNPREAAKLGLHIRSYTHRNNVSYLSREHWKKLQYTLGVLPLGLTPIEYQILQILKNNGESRVGHLAARTGLTSRTVQADLEPFLIRSNLVKIGKASMRQITPLGTKVLEEIEDSKKENLVTA